MPCNKRLSSERAVSAWNQVLPASGSTGGGLQVAMTAYGVGESLADVTVTMCGVSASLISLSGNIVTVTTPPCASAGTIEGTLSSNGVSAVFNFTYSEVLTLTSVTPIKGSVVDRNHLTLAGTGFSVTATDNLVMVGSSPCELSAANATHLICYTDGGAPGLKDVTVFVTELGFANQAMAYTNAFEVASVSPRTGSIAGGTAVTITGEGLNATSSQASVAIGESICDVTSATYTTLMCRTRPVGSSLEDSASLVSVGIKQHTALCEKAAQSVSIGGADLSMGACEFGFYSSSTPTVVSVSPTEGAVASSLMITVSGTGFSATPAENSVWVGVGPSAAPLWSEFESLQRCTVTSSTATELICELGASYASVQQVYVSVEGYGIAKGSPTFTFLVEVSALEPSSASRQGARVLISGAGFSVDTASASMEATVGSLSCETLVPVSHSSLECITASGGADNQFFSPVTVTVDSTSASCTSADCSFTTLSTLTPRVTSITPTQSSAVQTDNTITITGTGFTTVASNAVAAQDPIVTLQGVSGMNPPSGFLVYVAHITAF